MTNPITAFPLTWPHGKPRTEAHRRTWSKFKTNFGKARDECIGQIRTLGGREIIISTNLPLRLDGLPYANQAQPRDSGVAVYFTHKKRPMCFACDRWAKVETLPALEQSVALLNVNKWENCGGDMERNVQDAGYLSDYGYGPFWSIRGERAQMLAAFTHWMPLPSPPDSTVRQK